MLNKYCLDTHPLIWYFLGRKAISQRAKSLIQAGLNQETVLVVPTMVLLESFHISLKDTNFNFPRFLAKLKEGGTIIVSFDMKILNICYRLPLEINIHDRVIAATAIAQTCPIITRDEVLTKNFPEQVVWS